MSKRNIKQGRKEKERQNSEFEDMNDYISDLEDDE